jgi:inner membrane protein
MDPIAHTFTGMALAAAGLRRATPLAATALFMGVNAPDVDILSTLGPDQASLAFRRGWTHGVLALALWPFVLTGVLLAWDRYVRLRRRPDSAPARAGPLLGLTALAVLTHPALDWLNNYGMRWLMPFSGEWFYGDALVVIDPWIWLSLGGAAFLTFGRVKLARVRWTVFFALASGLVLFFASTGVVPRTSAVLWLAGVAALVAVRWWLRDAPPVALERAAQAGIAVAAVYIVAMIGSSAAARADVRATVAAQGIQPEDIMVAPAPGDPFGGEVVVMTRDEYYTGRFNWLMEPRVALDRERIPRPRGVEFQLAAQTPAARRFLVWSRYPAVDLEQVPDGGGIRVSFTDVRYRERGITGPTVHLLEAAVEGGRD